MEAALQHAQLADGARFDPGGGEIHEFESAARELDAAFDACALFDRSGLTRLRAIGEGALPLLQRLSTADLRGVTAGHGAQTVLTSAKGRVIARLFLHQLGEVGLVCIAGRGAGERLIEHLTRHTFHENVAWTDETSQTCQFSLVGPAIDDILTTLGSPRPEPGGSLACRIESNAATLVGTDGSSQDGVSWLVDRTAAAAVWSRLSAAVRSVGGRPAGSLAWDSWRVMQGIPESGGELNETVNPLEVGLREAVSFAKGCYVGQEVIARLNTYDKVSRTLVGVQGTLGDPRRAIGARLTLDGTDVGQVTSAVRPPEREIVIGLGLVKRWVLEREDQLLIDLAGSPQPIELVCLPFARSSARDLGA
jgi:hypothetical protein